MKIYRINYTPEFRCFLLKFKLIWSNDLASPSAVDLGIEGYSNRYNDYTYRLDNTSMEIMTYQEYLNYETINNIPGVPPDYMNAKHLINNKKSEN